MVFLSDLVLSEGSDFGGGYKLVSPGRCIRCKTGLRVRVGVGGKGNDGERSADPRGVCGMKAACYVNAEEHGYQPAPDGLACWKCMNESGFEGYSRVLALCVRNLGWVKKGAAAKPVIVFSDEILAALTASELDAMPTITVGQADDLKVDTGKRRVWLTRMTAADGYHGPAVIHEVLVSGRWVTCGPDGRPEGECA